MNKKLREAVDLALAGKWDDAHGIVQQFDGEPTAAWIHAVLHKIEGDQDNSRYWYRRAGKRSIFLTSRRGSWGRSRSRPRIEVDTRSHSEAVADNGSDHCSENCTSHEVRQPVDRR